MINIALCLKGKENTEFLLTKIATGKYFFKKIMPKTSYIKSKIISGASDYNDYKDSFYDTGFKL